MRLFLRRGEQVARAAGLTPQRQLLLLMIKGAPDGSEQATITELAKRLQLAQNTVTELVARAEAVGLLTREPSGIDGRVVHVRLTEEGDRRLAATVSGLRADRRHLVGVLSEQRDATTPRPEDETLGEFRRMDVRRKRVYEPATDTDGYRILADRLWPRGISRERAKLDEWGKELSPSTDLRRWFGHDPSRFEEFRRRYLDELSHHRPRIAQLRRRARSGPVTIVYAARDTEHNEAVVLADVLRRGLPATIGEGGV